MSRFNPELWEKHAREHRSDELTLMIAAVDALSIISDHEREQAIQLMRMSETLENISRQLHEAGLEFDEPELITDD